MIKRKCKFNGKTTESPATLKEEDVPWEMRPGGMFVQKRFENCSNVAARAPNLRILVAYGVMRYKFNVNSQITFGELKKILTEKTGLQVSEQQLFFHEKERENGDYLDMCGVKDGSKVVLMEDPKSIERRIIERRRNAKIQITYGLISDISVEINQIEQQVFAIEKSIANGAKVPELQITTLIEMLMGQAVKLDSISSDGDACHKKNLEGKRVQKCVEILDGLKLSNRSKKPIMVSHKLEAFDTYHATSKREIFD